MLRDRTPGEITSISCPGPISASEFSIRIRRTGRNASDFGGRSNSDDRWYRAGARAKPRSVGFVVLRPRRVDLRRLATSLAHAAAQRVGDLRQRLRAAPHEDDDEDDDQDEEEVAAHAAILLRRS